MGVTLIYIEVYLPNLTLYQSFKCGRKKFIIINNFFEEVYTLRTDYKLFKYSVK